MSVPSTPPESATTALYRAALGPVNTARYLEVFDRFDAAGRASPVWNPAAGLITLNWMVFRQLWGPSLVYIACAPGLALLVLGLARRFLQWPPSVEWGVLLALLLLSIAIPGAYGTALLHTDTRRRMTRAVREASTVREACAALEKQASSKGRLWLLAGINLLLVGAAAVAFAGLHQPSPPPLPQAVDTRVLPPSAAPPAEAPSAVASEPVAAAEPPASEPVSPSPEPVPVIVSPPVLPAPEPAVAASAPTPPASTPVPSPASPGSSPEPVRASAAPSKTPASVPAPVRAATPAKAAAPKDPGDAAPQAHGINVGLFADRSNAEKAHARLIEAGLPAILQTVESPRGERTRVRVGPFAGRAQAEEAAARIRAMGLDAVVFAP